MLRKSFLFFILILISGISQAQSPSFTIEEIQDSIAQRKIKLAKASSDLDRFYQLDAIAIMFHHIGFIDSCIYYGEKQLNLGLKMKKYDLAIERAGIALIENLYTVGELYKSLKLAYKLEKILKDINNTELLFGLYNAMGNNLKRQKEWDKAKTYYIKNIQTYLKDTRITNYKSHEIIYGTKEYDFYSVYAYAYMNLGICHYHTLQYDSAIYYSHRADSLMLEYGIRYRTAVLSVLARSYLKNDDLENGKKYMLLSYKNGLIEGELKREMLEAYLSAASYYKIVNQLDSAKYFTHKLIHFAHQLPVILLEQEGLQLAYEIYESEGNLDSAFYYLKRMVDVNKIIEEKAASIKLRDLEAKINSANDSIQFAYEKKEVDQIHEQEIAKKQQEKIYMYIILAFIGCVALVVIWKYRDAKRQRDIISKQKAIVENTKIELEIKNQEIIDSITYAKRIQSAILPSSQLIKENLPNSFVLYQPKDIVAGDFYWLEPKNGNVLFAAADCTGHGVPGAMVSVVCNNSLNRSVREFNLSEPAQILDKTREIVIDEFEKSVEDVKDGMDISLCKIDKENLKLSWAGANNPLWIIRDNECIEFKPDKQPIGKFDHPRPYTHHQTDLKKGDIIYIFSDGYIDQFGGEKGKKFKASQLKSLLLSIQNTSMENQMERLKQEFNTWKGNLEQVDDVCVIGVRV